MASFQVDYLHKDCIYKFRAHSKLPSNCSHWSGTGLHHAEVSQVIQYTSECMASLDKYWHWLHLEECEKGHTEHEGKPYCNPPFSSAMFTPKGFGQVGAELYTFK